MLRRPAPDQPLRVVLDTNVVLSMWVFADSRLKPLRRLVDAGRWLPLSSAPSLAEFRRVLGYPAFSLAEPEQQRVYAEYAAATLPVADVPAVRAALPACRDKDDQKFLELARDGRAHLLLTNDKALLRLAGRDSIKTLFGIVAPDALRHVDALTAATVR